MKSFLSVAVFLFVAVAQALSSSGNRLLVILDDLEEKAGYTKFFGDLESRGFTIAYETPKSTTVSLFKLGERLYDHVVLFPIKAKGLGPSLTAQIFVQFVNAKGNLLLALSSGASVPTAIVGLLSELDIAVPADRTGLVVDHFNYDATSAADKHDVLLLPPPSKLREDIKNVFGPETKTDTLLAFPNTIGHVLGVGPLLTPIVRAPRTAYSYNPKEEADTVDDLFAAGSQLSLVSAFQARNSARVVLVGSADVLSDKWFDAKVKPSGDKKAKAVATYNREFAKKVSGWTFQELGVLRVNSIEHHLNEKTAADNVTNPTMYKIKNDVTYSISVSEWAWDKWTAFRVPAADKLQLEFSMLSPFHRMDLQQDESRSSPDAAMYAVSFKLPDQHGIFNFKVNYKRPFFSNVEEKNTVSVRHNAHDEWTRSYAISGAWPWLTGILVTITGWVGFCALWMFSEPAKKPGSLKKTQ